MFFKRKAQYGNGFVVELEIGFSNGPVNRSDFLKFIDLVGCFQHLGAHIDFA